MFVQFNPIKTFPIKSDGIGCLFEKQRKHRNFQRPCSKSASKKISGGNSKAAEFFYAEENEQSLKVLPIQRTIAVEDSHLS